MIYLWISLLLILSYLIGSIPFGLIFGKVFKNIDIREHGSKNVGSTNATRVLGKKWGILTFICDCFVKGCGPILLVKLIGFLTKSDELFVFNNVNGIIMYGAVSVLGHIFPIYIKFKGGKAVATGVGVIIALYPVIGFAAGIGLFFVILLITGFASLGSVIATLTVGTWLWLDVCVFKVFEKNGLEYNVINLVLVSMLVLLIVIRHHKNYIRIFKGTEPRVLFGKRKQKYLEKKVQNEENKKVGN